MSVPFVLQYLQKKWLDYTLVILIQGHTQLGKSTAFKTIADKLNEDRYKKRWNHRKYCARNFNELLEYIDKYDNTIIGVEESSFQFSSAEWQKIQNKLFSYILYTQAYKHNLIFLVLPHSLGIARAHRRMIDVGIEVLEKSEEKRATLLRSIIYERTYWKLEEDSKIYHFLPYWVLTYSKEQMKHNKDFTDNFLIKYKKKIMNEIKSEWKTRKTVGIGPCTYCGSFHKKGECTLAFRR